MYSTNLLKNDPYFFTSNNFTQKHRLALCSVFALYNKYNRKTYVYVYMCVVAALDNCGALHEQKIEAGFAENVSLD